jgi:tetratricopeptide (TPR) repeat protein
LGSDSLIARDSPEGPTVICRPCIGLVIACCAVALVGQGIAATPPAEQKAAPRADLSEVNAAVRSSDWAKADELLAGLLEQSPDDPAALLMRGEVLLALGKPAEARPFLERALAADPARERTNFQLATVLEGAGEPEAALEHFAREIELTSTNEIKVLAQLNRSVLFAKLGRTAEAAAALEAALALDPDRPQVYGDLATYYLELGRLDEAAATLERGFEQGGFSSAQHYYVLGTRYYQESAYDKAIGAFEQALALAEGHADAERSLGAALDQLGREDEALPHLERYLVLRPDAPEAKQVRERIAAIKAE